MLSLKPLMLLPALSATLLIPFASAQEQEKSSKVDFSIPTHKQVELYTPEFNGEKLKISTFCLDGDQNFLFCSGGSANSGLLSALFGGSKSLPPQLTRISPDREVLDHVELSFIPTAINVAPDGDIFVAGSGTVARLSKDLEILSETKNPHIEDYDAYREKKRTEVEAQVRQSAEQMAQMLKVIDEKIKQIEDIAADERTAAQKAELASCIQTKTILGSVGMGGQDEASIAARVEARLNQGGNMPSLAVTDKDVFVTISSGFGYEVWRLDHDLSKPERVVSRVRGCCGQLDIQTDGTDLLVAENSRFRVVRFTRDGKKQNQFGSRSLTQKDGFGSCCNPMNLRCCSNGDLLTAESSIGDIKRFSPEGKLLGYIGKASIASGCKQVTLGHDSVRNRFYMYHKEKNALCVLIPMSEAPEFTAEELAAKKAREGLGEKLVGNWSLEKAEDAAGNPLFSGLGIELKAPGNFEFFADGRMNSDGGLTRLLKNENPEAAEMEGYETQTGWLAKEQKGDKQLVVFATVNRVEQEQLVIDFEDESQASISGRLNGIQIYKATYKKVIGD